ncbi:MAG: (E)-4-hydroxy-3-methylbut-2-enyl-diphosphate synthase [Treponema sp.]|nr:(E)-4-hydroxy-3-methylbut-2-enyl-diphosphate synthase [Treponema sp.]
MKGSRVSKPVKIGGFDHVDTVFVGGGFPIVLQTMWKDRLTALDIEGENAQAFIDQIERLKKLGCRMLRFAAPTLEAAEVLGRAAEMVSMPFVADIHFDYKIALRCLDFPIAKIRINPGNIGGKNKVEAVLSKAAARSRPIRIGVNAGSLPTDLRLQHEEGSLSSAEALVLAAEREIAIFGEFGFTDYLVSMKASSVADTIKANRLLAERSDVALHIGVTEAGPLIPGVVRNAAALTLLLGEGIGDTIRVSLTDNMESEIIAGREILAAAADIAKGEGRTMRTPEAVNLVSCPRCGRNSFDTHGFTQRWQEKLYSLDKDLNIAIMGCAVNGPGEARSADLGITGAGDKVLLFRKGKVIRTIDTSEADAAFEEELNRL